MSRPHPQTRTVWVDDRWWTLLLISGCLLTLVGYFGPWVNHKVAGLAILGLDLAEYVKFLPPVRSGQIPVKRELFYLPLVAVSCALSLWIFRLSWLGNHHQASQKRRFGLAEIGVWGGRFLLLGLAVMAALNLLPPAWTPDRLITPEFRLQTGVMVTCLALAALAPFWVLLPRRGVGWTVTGMALFAGGAAPLYFLRVLPAIEPLYGHPLMPGWGVGVCILGLLGVAVSSLRLGYSRAT